jgi:hypothetical protein
MEFLNLSLGQVLALFGVIGAGVVALYLLDRSRRRQTVASLRFWTTSDAPTESKHRRRIRQPWSLLLQLLSLLLLLLAISQIRWSAARNPARDHVLLLDASAWMGARSGSSLLMDQAKAAALGYLKILPAGDRVMLVRADALSTPATGFTTDRARLEAAVRATQPGSSALQLSQALAFALQAQKMQSSRSGEIVLAGGARLNDEEPPVLPANFRLLPVKSADANTGLRRIGLRRAPADPESWEIFVSVRNYGGATTAVPVAVQFAGAPVGSRTLTLAPGAEQEITFTHRTRAAGWLEARLLLQDSFPQDNRAVIELPEQPSLKVLVYSNEPELLRPLLAANPNLEAQFRTPAQYEAGELAALRIFDRFAPPDAPAGASLWISPPAGRSPIPIRATRSGARLVRWRAETPLGAGLRTAGIALEESQIFQAAPADVVVAEAETGPVIVARRKETSSTRYVVLGFHPMKTALRYELAAPLLFANLLRWMVPEVFRRWELSAGSTGTLVVSLDPDQDPSQINVFNDDGVAIPFTVEQRQVRIFAGAPGTVRMIGGDRERVFSLNLPAVPEADWQPSAEVRRGVPRSAGPLSAAWEWWPWLALAGGLGLLADWLLFGQPRVFRAQAAPAKASAWRKAS